MSLTFFGAGATALGLLGLAGGLYALQRLRVRHREVSVVTSLFWKEAVEETRARELKLRFRHPLAYLFILAIASALWLAASGLQLEAAPARRVVCLLDGSAGMARDGRFGASVLELRETLAGLPASARSAVFCGATPRTLLLPGEELAWFDRRVAELGPEAAPASVETQLFALEALATPELPVTAMVFGDAHLDEEALALLSPNVELLTFTELRDGAAECGITALGVTPAASGDWAATDLLVELGGSAARDVALELDGVPLVLEPEVVEEPGRRRLLYRDLPARGGLLVARLVGADRLAADDEASLVLPERTLLRITTGDGTPERLRFALLADPGVEVVNDSPEVWVGAQAPEGSAQLTFDGEGAGLTVFAPRGDAGLAGFLIRLDELGVTAGVALRIEEGPARALVVGVGALDPALGWTESRSFPLFVAEGVRWLAGAADGARFVAAGRPLDDTLPRTDTAGLRLDPVGASFTPPTAGLFLDEGERSLAVSLLDRATTDDAEGAFRVDTPTPLAGDPTDLAALLALLAFVALLVEWALVQRSRIP